MDHSMDYRRLTRRMAVVVALLGVLAGVLIVAASSAFAQENTQESTSVTPAASTDKPAQVYALTPADSSGNQQLLLFNADDPSKIKDTIDITGLASGESLVGIDFRPSNNELYGVDSQGNIYTIDTSTGAATDVGTIDSHYLPLKGTYFGVDFDPSNDHLRIVSDQDLNLDYNPKNDSTNRDTRLNYTDSSTDPKVTAIAYDNDVPNATGTLYDIDTGIDYLDTQEPPELGTLTKVGSLGLNAKPIAGFDIVTAFDTNNNLVNNGYAALQPKGKNSSSFYSIDLTTGKATKIGRIDGKGTMILDIAIPIGGRL